MRHHLHTAIGLFSLLALLSLSERAQAQARPASYSRPTVSPYTSLGGAGGGLNYFNIVRPELELRSLLTKQGQNIQTLEQRTKESARKDATAPKQEDFTLPRTGHRTYYSTYSHYFGRR